jgi:hypothetical protein
MGICRSHRGRGPHFRLQPALGFATDAGAAGAAGGRCRQEGLGRRREAGTVAAYTAYLQNFGSGAHVSEVSQRIVALNDAARKAADEKAWADAEKAGTAAAYTAYIQNFGGGAHVAEARQRLAALDEQARKEADEKAWADAEKGSDAHVAEARQRAAALDGQAREADEKAWADALRAGTAGAFTGYVQKFGSGAHVAEARQRAAALETQGRKEVPTSDIQKTARLPPV